MKIKDYTSIIISIIALILSAMSLFIAQYKYNNFRAVVSNLSWNFQKAKNGKKLLTLDFEADVSFVNDGKYPVVVEHMYLNAYAYGPNQKEIIPFSVCINGSYSGHTASWKANAVALKSGDVATKHLHFDTISFTEINDPPYDTNEGAIIVCAKYDFVDFEGKSHSITTPLDNMIGIGGIPENNAPSLLKGKNGLINRFSKLLQEWL